MASMTSLRQWLRKEPQPKRLRVRTVDDQERTIELDPDVRKRWKTAEEAILALRSVAVECLGRDDEIMRAKDLAPPDEDTGVSSGEGASEILAEKLNMTKLSNERKEFALALDRYGARLVEAFQAGAAAASEQQDKLVGLVEVLTNNLSTSIVNLHNISVELAQARADAGSDGESTPSLHGANQSQLMALLAAGLMKGGEGSEDAAANGKPKK
jgi:hypothetical protein